MKQQPNHNNCPNKLSFKPLVKYYEQLEKLGGTRIEVQLPTAIVPPNWRDNPYIVWALKELHYIEK